MLDSSLRRTRIAILDVGESTLDVGEQTVGETTGYRNFTSKASSHAFEVEIKTYKTKNLCHFGRYRVYVANAKLFCLKSFVMHGHQGGSVRLGKFSFRLPRSLIYINF